jgi:putative holliday junction resolvase
MRYICLDLGKKRVGVAVSESGLIASPHTVLYVTKRDKLIQEILRLIEKIEAEKLIIGLPLHLNGDEGIEAGRARDFAAEIQRHTSIPIEFMDERLSSVEAERLMMLEGMRRDKRKANIDARAAAIILQSYLDRERINRTRGTEAGGQSVEDKE